MTTATLSGFALSPQQRHLWVLAAADPAMSNYRAGCALRVAGDLDPRALRAAVATVVERYEILHTSYQRLDGMAWPLQVIARPELGWLLADLNGLPSSHRGTALSALSSAIAAASPTAPVAGPVLSVALVRLDAAEHLLLIALPALASDEIGIHSLVAAIASAYAGDAGNAGNTAGGEAEPLQYADLAAWQNDLLTAVEASPSREHWRQLDLGSLSGLSLPGERDALTGFVPGAHVVVLGSESAAALTALATHRPAGPAPVALAAWLVLLERLTGRSVVVGTAFDGRRHPELAEVPGLFARHLPLAVEVHPDQPWRELLTRVEAAWEEAAELQEGFDWEDRSGGAAERPAYWPVAFAWDPGRPPLAAGPLRLTWEACYSWFDRFRIRLCLRRERGGLALEVQFDTLVLRQADAARLAAQLAALLAEALAAPGTAVGDLPVLRGAERSALLAQHAATALDLPGAPRLDRLWEESAEAYAERVAVWSEDGVLTYRELGRAVDLLAEQLHRSGVGPEVLVGVCIERTLALPIALLAVLKAGGAYLALDPDQPSQRLAAILADARPAMLVAEAERRLPPLPSGTRVVGFATADLLASAVGGEAKGASATGDASGLAYVLYTSGSTGLPKGVAVSHGAIANRLLWMRHAFSWAEDEAILQKTPFGFDASIWEIFLPLLIGGRMVLARPGGHRDSAYLVALTAAQDVTVLQLVPSMLGPFLAEPGLERCRRLRRIFCGGEALPSELARRVKSSMNAELINLYGPTEAAIDATFWPVAEDDGPTVPIGRPIANVQVHVLDGRLGPLPSAVEGELFIGGRGLARGYLGQPDRTAERFLPSPFATFPGERLYRTGDRVRQREGGEIEFLGRRDQQVKVLGWRIELSEIEAAIASHPGVKEVAVVMHREENEPARLVAYVAYVVATGGSEPADSELRTWLLPRLPEVMVPATFVAVEELPRLASGKLDRQALAAQRPLPAGAARGDLGPRTLREELVSQIWSEVLGEDSVGAHGDFFAAGGNSLSATQIVSRVRHVFGVELPIRSLFESPGFAAFATRIDEARQVSSPGVPPLIPLLRSGPLPLSFAQQRLWFLDRLGIGQPVYNIPASVRLLGELDRRALGTAFAEVVRRHEVLRTVFADGDGDPVQIVQPGAALVLPEIDVSGLAEAARAAETARLVSEEARCGFDLTTGPTWRARLLRCGEAGHVLLLTLHHIVSDGWSAGILQRELAALYRAFSSGQRSSLPPLPIQYADFACWQRQWLASGVLEGQLSYWRERLNGAPGLLELCTDRPRPALPTSRGTRHVLYCPEALRDALRDLSRQQGVTLFMTLLAAFDTLLYRYTNSLDLVVGVPVANRNRTEIEGLIGFFANTLVLRTELSGDLTFPALLGRVREVTLGAADHQDLPFERLVDALQLPRQLDRTPLFQNMFVFQNAPVHAQVEPRLTLRPLTAHSGTAKFDLTLEMADLAAGLTGTFEFRLDLFDLQTIERMAGHFVALLDAMAADPGCAISELPLLSERERRQLLAISAPQAAMAGEAGTLDRLFALRAAATPFAEAVSCGSERITYGELERRAHRVARYLRSLGCGPETLVGLVFSPTVELVVAILGTLKAGAAYLPLDPELPAERLALLVADSGVRVLLTVDRLSPQVEGLDCQVFRLPGDLGEDAGEGGTGEEEVGESAADPANAAYVIYTSGSTGRPKGVVVCHREVIRLFAATASWCSPGADDVWTLFHSYAFDFSVWEIWGALLHGGRLVIVPENIRRSPVELYDLLATERVTILSQTPSAFAQLAKVEEEGISGGLDPALRLVILGGEALHPESLGGWFARHGDHRPRLVNMYGITETTVHVTVRSLRVVDSESGASPIGSPIPDLGIYLLDTRQQLVPLGVAGEICVAGAGLARGYYRQPGLTVERFVPSPAGPPGARLYRSGDLARRRVGGEIEYLGRIDDQVKVRGFRVEVREIEAALRRMPEIGEAVVLLRRDAEDSHERLVAYLVAGSGMRPQIEEVRISLARELPEYMMPAAFVFLDRLPLTTNGKIDRNALPSPSTDRPDLSSRYISPRTEKEGILARIWAAVLNLERIGIGDNFFVLGGDSMHMLQVVSQARKAGLELTIQQLYRHQTIAELAASAEPEGVSPAAAVVAAPAMADERWESLIDEVESLSEGEALARVLARVQEVEQP